MTPPHGTASSPRSMYHIFRRQFHYNAKCLTLSLVVLFITLNFLVYTKFNSFFRQDPEQAVERRETNPLIRLSPHPFPEAPKWMNNWLLYQKLDPHLNKTEGKDLKIDIVYTWVNGSDSKLRAMKEQYQDTSPFFKEFHARARSGIRGILRVFSDERKNSAPSSPSSASASSEPSSEEDETANRFRDMNELKYSVRSVAQYASTMFKRIHILTTNVDPESNEAQMPSWLDPDKSSNVIRLVHHDMIFENQSVLPSFNSLAIESQIHHTPDLTDVFLYLNDDVFLGTTILPSDIWTPLFGFVFHFEPTLLVPPRILEPPKDLEVGEWNSLQYSNYLLSKQFGYRYRPYLAHIPHVLSVPMLQEIQEIWPEAFAMTSSHRFRGEGQAMDVQVSFFMAHYVMERLRETQLSSYWFHRLDANQDGILDWSERHQLIQRVELWNTKAATTTTTTSHVNELNFSSFLEDTNKHLDQLGYDSSGSSTYKLSGLDGYPFMLKNTNTILNTGNWDPTPFNANDQVKDRTCHLNVDFCLGSTFKDNTISRLDMSTSSDIFQRLAFTEFHCGDCLLHILGHTATQPGLASEIMPLDKESVAFSTVSDDLARYNYVVASSYYSFVQLEYPYDSQKSLDQVMQRKNSNSFICINDNLSDDPRIIHMVQDVFQRFLDNRFSIPSPWEKK